MNFIPDTIVRAVCWTLLHSLWQGLILAIVAGGILVLSKKAGSALRYNTLCSLLLLFVLVSGYTFYHQLATPAASPALERTANAGVGPASAISRTAAATPSRLFENIYAPLHFLLVTKTLAVRPS